MCCLLHVELAQTFDVNICTDSVHYEARLKILSWELFKFCAGKEQPASRSRQGTEANAKNGI